MKALEAIGGKAELKRAVEDYERLVAEAPSMADYNAKLAADASGSSCAFAMPFRMRSALSYDGGASSSTSSSFVLFRVIRSAGFATG